jgi:hypothetical protein
MGMVPSGTPAYLVLESGTVLGDPSPATAANNVRLQGRPSPKPRILDPTPIVHQVVGNGPSADSLEGRGNEGRPATRDSRDD